MPGPFQSTANLPPLHFNRFGVIPKAGKWRLITDLSYPEGLSLNHDTDPDICPLCYTTVDSIADRIFRIGKGSLLAKVDIEAAYRLVPVHPDDCLRAMSWESQMYVDPMLPFGGTST